MRFTFMLFIAFMIEVLILIGWRRFEGMRGTSLS
jgi:hypothetical protein